MSHMQDQLAGGFQTIMENLGGVPGAASMMARELNSDNRIKLDLKRCCSLPEQTRDQDLIVLARRLQAQVYNWID